MTREQLERIKDEAAVKGRALTADEGYAVADRAAPMTPAEIAAAKILAAWSEWPGTEADADAWEELSLVERSLKKLGNRLTDLGYVSDKADDLSDEGNALLLRARANGHLP